LLEQLSSLMEPVAAAPPNHARDKPGAGARDAARAERDKEERERDRQKAAALAVKAQLAAQGVTRCVADGRSKRAAGGLRRRPRACVHADTPDRPPGCR
jgi:hypothetical protein